MSAKKKKVVWRKVFVVLFVLYMGALIYLYFGKLPTSLKLPRTLWGIPRHNPFRCTCATPLPN